MPGLQHSHCVAGAGAELGHQLPDRLPVGALLALSRMPVLLIIPCQQVTGDGALGWQSSRSKSAPTGGSDCLSRVEQASE